MFRKLRFQSKLSATVSLLITILFLFSGFLLDYISVRNTRSSWEDSSQQTLNSLSSAITGLITDMDILSKDIHSSDAVVQIFRDIPQNSTHNYFDMHTAQYSAISSAMYAALGSMQLKGQITIVSRYGDTVTLDNRTGRLVLSKSEILDIPSVHWGLTTTQYSHIFLSEVDPWHRDYALSITLARPLRNSYTTYGTILISYPITVLDTISHSYLQNTDSYIAILGQSGDIQYDFSATATVPEPENWLDMELINNASTPMQYYSGRSQIYINTLGNQGLHLAQIRGIDDLQWQIIQFRIALTLSYLAVLFFVLLCTHFIMRRLTIPLGNLRNQLSSISLDGTLDLPISEENDEIRALSETITGMVQRFQIQKAHLLEARERDLKSRLNAMEAQLNSHFLYNTLAVIGAVGQMEGSATTPYICAKLGNLLRYSVDYNFQCVTLSDELQNIRDYLDIMQLRHDGQTDFIWDLDPAANTIAVPKLILQPIVENCFKHGFADTVGIRRIKITTQCTENTWTVSIENNGTMPSPQALETLYQRLAHYRAELGQNRLDAREKDCGFGLGNTVLRLHLYYKGNEIFNIHAQEHGTIVQIGGSIHAQ